MDIQPFFSALLCVLVYSGRKRSNFGCSNEICKNCTKMALETPKFFHPFSRVKHACLHHVHSYLNELKLRRRTKSGIACNFTQTVAQRPKAIFH